MIGLLDWREVDDEKQLLWLGIVVDAAAVAAVFVQRLEAAGSNYPHFQRAAG